MGTLEIAGRATPRDVVVHGHAAYVATRRGAGQPELSIVDVSVPGTPRLLGSLHVQATVNKVVVSGDHAFLATGRPHAQLLIVDVSDARRPLRAGAYGLPGASPATAVALVAGPVVDRPQTLVLLGTARGSGTELHAIDATDPRRPELLDSLEVDGTVRDIAVAHHTAYLATTHPGREVMVVDVADPHHLRLRGSYDLPGESGATAIDVAADRLYVTTADNGSLPDFYVLDLPDPSGTLTLVSSVDLGTTNLDLAVQGDTAYVATLRRARGLSIVRLDGASPRRAASLPTAAPAVALGLGTDRVYTVTADPARALRVIDPGAPLASLEDVNGDGFITTVCLGDSNTMLDHFGNVRRSWCELLDDAISNPNWVFVNRAFLGMTAVDLGRVFDGKSLYVDAPVADAGIYVDSVIAADRADAVALAFGTNDLRNDHGMTAATPAELVEAYRRHAAKLARHGVARVFVALTPPTFPPFPGDAELITRANDLLRTAFPPDAVLDFFAGMTPEDYQADGLHLGDRGQHKRMQVVYRRLLAGD